jgi:hypothetical protein
MHSISSALPQGISNASDILKFICTSNMNSSNCKSIYN